MLFKRLNEASDLCVLRVSTDVLKLKGTVITDQNAASEYVRFLDPKQWSFLAFDDIYADDWRHPGDQVAYWKHKARMCAEVLVPACVEADLLLGAHVVDDAALAKLRAMRFGGPVVISPSMFFR
jgi:hypothetical protein